jgi:hypothetical protein
MGAAWSKLRFLAAVAGAAGATLVGCATNEFVLADAGGSPRDDASVGNDAGAGDASNNADTSGSVDGGRANDGGPVVVCPMTPPTAGSACPIINHECEYGTNPNALCNQTARCSATGWTYPSAVCPMGGHCPMSYASVPTGQSCQPQGLVCGFVEGVCTCWSSGNVVRIDGGAGPQWKCFPVGQGCPSPRPNIGTSCSRVGLNCDYGACNGGLALECRVGGAWQRALTACPL